VSHYSAQTGSTEDWAGRKFGAYPKVSVLEPGNDSPVVAVSISWPAHRRHRFSSHGAFLRDHPGTPLHHRHERAPDVRPVVSDVPSATHQHYLISKEWLPPAPDDSIAPSSAWRFPVIDVWPTDRPPIKLTSFTPVSEAVPDELAADDTVAIEKWVKSTSHRSKLRMIGWVRPVYTHQQARNGDEGTAQVSVHVNARGQPVEELLMSSSGYPELDSATLKAALQWRFAPPVSRSEPISVWAELEVRYHCCETAQPDR
jgi:TonB family protein